jgi:hypothetical protein
MPIPKIQVAFNGWESPIKLIKITSSIVEYEKVFTRAEVNFKGVVQPLTAEALKIKPLESRSWEWLMIHTRTSAEIFTNDLIEYNGKEYKVMFENNYNLNNYYEYHLVKNYE